jgi:hypothetical protein
MPGSREARPIRSGKHFTFLEPPRSFEARRGGVGLLGTEIADTMRIGGGVLEAYCLLGPLASRRLGCLSVLTVHFYARQPRLKLIGRTSDEGIRPAT